jgi:hypothetical protein
LHPGNRLPGPTAPPGESVKACGRWPWAQRGGRAVKRYQPIAVLMAYREPCAVRSVERPRAPATVRRRRGPVRIVEVSGGILGVPETVRAWDLDAEGGTLRETAPRTLRIAGIPAETVDVRRIDRDGGSV